MSESEMETQRLEALWAGEFGDDYVERNRDAESGRRDFWAGHLQALGVRTALEVGCNIGGNLRWIAEILGVENVAGVDVNEKALAILRESHPGIDARLARGAELPFADGEFDL